MNEKQYHNTSYFKYLGKYHIIWYSKYHYCVLRNGVDVTRCAMFYGKVDIFISSLWNINESMVKKYFDFLKFNIE